MENNKYYTPEIGEFRVGFEYEYGLPKEGQVEWNTDTFGKIIRSVFELEWLIKNKNIRVKFLDAQDIEELGFKEDTLRSIPGIRGCFNKEPYTIVIFSNNKIMIRNMEYDINPVIYQGTILNKSELIFILKRIGVL